MANAPASGGPVSEEFLADLAAASRILATRGVVDAFGHISQRHPYAPDRYFMSRSRAPALVEPEDLIEYSLDSEPVNADGRGSFLERFIHGEVYKARSDVVSVVHSHSPSVIPFGLADAGMRAMFHNAAFLAQEIPVFDISEKFGVTDMLVSDPEKGVAFAECVGDSCVTLMRAHGSIACGENLQTAVFRAVYTEVNARIQHWTEGLAHGGRIAALSEEEGALADVPNRMACFRAWELWRKEVRDETGW
ncbi:MAG: class II aldolase/adducin family protein [Alphaproteobacteria bacterium]